MKIALNATSLNDRPSGAKQRFVGIYGELVARLTDAEFVIYEPADCRVGSWFGDASNVSVRRTPVPSEGRLQKMLQGARYWSAALSRERFDIVESLTLPMLKAPTGRMLLTIHDVRMLHRKYGGAWQALYRYILRSSLDAADHVIAVSETMKKEILAFHPGKPISVVYNGLDASMFDQIPSDALSLVSKRLALPQEFVLAVGHFEKRKNHLRLVDAMARLRQRGSSCPLVIVGNDSGEKRALESRIGLTRSGDHVHLLSGLSDHDVRCVYKLCSLFVFPSLYEGFGIPILEAMAADRPMALSDIPVFREITQDQGIFFDPDDVEAMAMAIERALGSSSARARMLEHGRNRVQDFAFQALAGQVELLYRTLASN